LMNAAGFATDSVANASDNTIETTADMARLDDLINEVTSQVRSLARQRKRAERHAEITTRRFAVELTLASREMAAWKDELEQLDERLIQLREQLPHAQNEVIVKEAQRDAAHAARAASETVRHERARVAGEAREAALKLQGEIAVAEERHRNAVSRRERAEAERSEGAAIGERVVAEWEAARAEEEQTTRTRRCCTTLGNARRGTRGAGLHAATRRARARNR
ncbi:MAG: hypothetical protein EBR15_09700, partial [Gammaproteobacteria bacterium]|nr:hypothetical protein [Gammaproteobacteria bacterium]